MSLFLLLVGTVLVVLLGVGSLIAKVRQRVLLLIG